MAVPDTITYPGSDYYELEVRQFTQKLHSDLPATTLRGYVQTNNGTDADGDNTIEPAPIMYLGPMIVAQKDRPVRIKFTNKLPLGEEGDLFIPVDTTVMGAGMGPIEDPMTPGMREEYTQNRAVIHLHGGHTPWISDGTPHQWITPAGENTSYPKGVSAQNVPDMPDPGEGAQTYYYTQPAERPPALLPRPLLGHHAPQRVRGRGRRLPDQGRGRAGPDRPHGVIPSGADEIPLIIQDKTFVDANTVRTTDPTWNWGTGARSTPSPASARPRPATSGTRTSTCRPRTRTTVDGVNPFGPLALRPVVLAADDRHRSSPSPTPTTTPVNAPWEPPEMPGVPRPVDAG